MHRSAWVPCGGTNHFKLEKTVEGSAVTRWTKDASRVNMASDKSSSHFFTATGIEVPAVTADDMREVDRIAMEETGPNLYQMMENAGRNLALMAIEFLRENWQKTKVVVLAGGGGNGGGGICAARHLANRGVDVRLLVAQSERLSKVPGWQRKIFQSAGGTEIDRSRLPEQRPDLILDALIGYGLNSAPDENMAHLIRWQIYPGLRFSHWMCLPAWMLRPVRFEGNASHPNGQ